jgi:hypothetical protein
MNIRWVESQDNFSTKTAQLQLNDNTLVEIIQYDGDACEMYGDLFETLPFESKYFEDTREAKKYVENVNREFCVEFNIWYAR